MKDKKEKVFIVGFPKSGNTWMTRLFSDIFSSPSDHWEKEGEDLEIASDLNNYFLKKNPNPRHIFLKTHVLPDVLFEKNKDKNIRIVYVVRDFRDILVSSFFAKHKFTSLEERDILILPFLSLISRGPFFIFRYFYFRYKFRRHIFDISSSWSNKNIGSWQVHTRKWRNYLKKDSVKMSLVRYEDLLINTKKEVLRILKEVQLPLPQDKDLNESIKRQSFSVKKEYFKNLDKNENIPKGVDFNYRFLRKGESGDWKNFLSKKMRENVFDLGREELIKNKYEENEK